MTLFLTYGQEFLLISGSNTRVEIRSHSLIIIIIWFVLNNTLSQKFEIMEICEFDYLAYIPTATNHQFLVFYFKA